MDSNDKRREYFDMIETMSKELLSTRTFFQNDYKINSDNDLEMAKEEFNQYSSSIKSVIDKLISFRADSSLYFVDKILKYEKDNNQ